MSYRPAVPAMLDALEGAYHALADRADATDEERQRLAVSRLHPVRTDSLSLVQRQLRRNLAQTSAEQLLDHACATREVPRHASR